MDFRVALNPDMMQFAKELLRFYYFDLLARFICVDFLLFDNVGNECGECDPVGA